MMNLIGIGISIGLGFIVIPWVTLRNRIVDWSFGRKKQNINDSMVIKELKIENRKLQNDKKNLWKTILDKANESQKIDIIVDKFHEFLESNEDTSFDDLEKWLSNKIDERDKIWEQEQIEQIDIANKKWHEFKNKLQAINSWQCKNELYKRIEYDKYKNIKIKKKQLKENKKELKQYSQELYNDFEKNEINSICNLSSITKQEEYSSILTNSLFKSLNQDNPQPSTSQDKLNTLNM